MASLATGRESNIWLSISGVWLGSVWLDRQAGVGGCRGSASRIASRSRPASGGAAWAPSMIGVPLFVFPRPNLEASAYQAVNNDWRFPLVLTTTAGRRARWPTARLR